MKRVSNPIPPQTTGGSVTEPLCVPVSEERIRQIIREELAAWEKQQVQARRFGLPVRAEVK